MASLCCITGRITEQFEGLRSGTAEKLGPASSHVSRNAPDPPSIQETSREKRDVHELPRTPARPKPSSTAQEPVSYPMLLGTADETCEACFVTHKTRGFREFRAGCCLCRDGCIYDASLTHKLPKNRCPAARGAGVRIMTLP